jgi:serine/threonine protein kinase
VCASACPVAYKRSSRARPRRTQSAVERAGVAEFALISSDAFDLDKPLGRGKSGKVQLARYKDLQFAVALKVLSMPQLKEENVRDQLRREIDIQMALRFALVASMVLLRLRAHPHNV